MSRRWFDVRKYIGRGNSDGVMPEHVTSGGESPRGDTLDCRASGAPPATDKAPSLFVGSIP